LGDQGILEMPNGVFKPVSVWCFEPQGSNAQSLANTYPKK